MSNICTFNNAEFLPHVIAMTNMGKKVRIPLKGFSMRPFLEDGRDSAVLVKIDRPLRINDIVLAELSPGRYALHRIIKLENGKVQMLGDGNITPDPIISEANVKALALSFYRKGRDTQDFVASRKFIVYSWIWTRLRPIRRYLLFIYRKAMRL